MKGHDEGCIGEGGVQQPEDMTKAVAVRKKIDTLRTCQSSSSEKVDQQREGRSTT